MNDETKNIIALIISGYAALVSTISILWNIINTIIDKMSRVKIRYNTFVSTFSDVNNDDEMAIGASVLSVSIINVGKKVKYINKPKLKLSYKVTYAGSKIDEVHLFLLDSKDTWPKMLKPEEEINVNYPFRDGTEWFLKDYPKRAKVRIMVTDTINKKYYSKKMKVKIIENIISHNKDISEDNYRFSVRQYR